MRRVLLAVACVLVHSQLPEEEYSSSVSASASSSASESPTATATATPVYVLQDERTASPNFLRGSLPDPITPSASASASFSVIPVGSFVRPHLTPGVCGEVVLCPSPSGTRTRTRSHTRTRTRSHSHTHKPKAK